MSRLARRVMMGVWKRAASRAAHRFSTAVAHPADAQKRAKQRVVDECGDTARGRELQLGGAAASEEQWARDIPLATYEDLRPWVDRIVAGESGVLSRSAVQCLEPTGGTTGADKLVPITRALLSDIAAATTPWVHDLMLSYPQIARGRSYWAISPPVREQQRTEGGVRIGMLHDSEYFPRMLRPLVESMLGMPAALSDVRDLGANRHVTLLALLGMEDLAMVSVWSPSFFTLLADALDGIWDSVLRDMQRGRLSGELQLDPAVRRRLDRALPWRTLRRRARVLRARFGHDAPRDLGEVWPALALVSCWTDAYAARSVPALRERLPNVEIQGKGLLATEGVTSIPWHSTQLAAPVAAVDSHVIELLPIADGATAAGPRDMRDGSAAVGIASRAVEPGMRAEVVLSTTGGFVRYRTFDVVEIVGHVPGTRTPLLRFVGRADRAGDLAGEKLVPEFVGAAMAVTRPAGTSGFALLVADAARPGWTLVVDADQIDDAAAAAWATALERALAAGHHYALCRELGQLEAVGVARVPRAMRVWEQACAALGQRAGTLKLDALDPRPELWDAMRRLS